MRYLTVVAACALALAGCFKAKPEAGDEIEAVSEALTRAVNFEGGNVEDGRLPGEDAPDVLLVPFQETVLMSPGQTSLMALDVDNPDEEDDPVVATLLQFEKGRRHIRVTRDTGTDGSSTGADIENHFTVDEDVCDGLCNKRFSIKVVETLRTRSGRVGRHSERTLELDCSEAGEASACRDRGDSPGKGGLSTGGNGAQLLPDVVAAVDNLCRCDSEDTGELICEVQLADVDTDCAINALNLYETAYRSAYGDEPANCALLNLPDVASCARSCPSEPTACIARLEDECSPWRLLEAEAIILSQCALNEIPGSDGTGGFGGAGSDFGGSGGSGGSGGDGAAGRGGSGGGGSLAGACSLVDACCASQIDPSARSSCELSADTARIAGDAACQSVLDAFGCTGE